MFWKNPRKLRGEAVRWRRIQTFLVLGLCPGILACASWSLDEEERLRFWRLQSGQEMPALEQRICEVHGVETELTTVFLSAGLCVEHPARYVRARLRDFPNSFWEVQGCFCEGPDGLPLRSDLCPEESEP